MPGLPCCKGFSLVVVSGATLYLRCLGFSLWWLLLLWRAGSRARGFQLLLPPVSRAQAQSLWAQAWLFYRMWGLPRSEMEPLSPALAGGLSATEPPGKPYVVINQIFFWLLSCVSSLYILDMKLFSDRWLPNIFSHSIGHLLIFLILSLVMQKQFSLILALFFQSSCVATNQTLLSALDPPTVRLLLLRSDLGNRGSVCLFKEHNCKVWCLNQKVHISCKGFTSAPGWSSRGFFCWLH